MTESSVEEIVARIEKAADPYWDEPYSAEQHVDDILALIADWRKRGEALEAREWEGYINGLTKAGNLRSTLVVDDGTGRVLNDIRAQIQEEIDSAWGKLRAVSC
jgi:hypothetical protein